MLVFYKSVLVEDPTSSVGLTDFQLRTYLLFPGDYGKDYGELLAGRASH